MVYNSKVNIKKGRGTGPKTPYQPIYNKVVIPAKKGKICSTEPQKVFLQNTQTNFATKSQTRFWTPI